jgi:iron complex transport system substrate-binding protein
MRIVSLLPAATEIVAALGVAIGEGAADGTPKLVGISHECDEPERVRALPRVTTSTIDPHAVSGDIDRAVRTALAAGRSPISIDVPRLAALRPDVLIGQSLCDVCAVGGDDLAHAAAALSPRPTVVTMHAHTLDAVFGDMLTVGAAIGLRDEADELVAGLRYRLRQVASHAPTTPHPTVLVLEWLDPPYVAGHWVPELVAIAGGQDVGNTAGARSAARPWRELAALGPEKVIVALCGFDVPRARQEAAAVRDVDALRLFSGGVEFLDGNAYTSRPGPRLIQAARLLALMLR